jgi:hypothetical protein
MTNIHFFAVAWSGDRRPRLRSWRTAASVAAVAGGATAAAGCFLPWVTALAGLESFPGMRGSNGKLLAAGGILIAVAGLWHLIGGSAWSRWTAGLLGAIVAGGAGYLLLQLQATMKSLGGDSMMLVRGGPGLWLVAAGGLIAFGTMFLPAPGQPATGEPAPDMPERADG